MGYMLQGLLTLETNTHQMKEEPSLKEDNFPKSGFLVSESLH